MPPAPKNTPTRAGVDLDQLMKMVEPLTVHVTRLRGNSKETIPLPVKPGYEASGVGWTIPEVKEIEQQIVEISGGGIYEVQVTDSTEPNALSTKWSFVLPPETYAMRTPITMQRADVAAMPTPQVAPAPGLVMPTPTYPGAYPGAYPNVGPGWPQPAPWWAQPQATPIRPPTPPAPTSTDREQQLREELHRRDLAAIEERHRHERDMAEFRRQQEQLAAAAQAPKGPDPALVALEARLAEERAARERVEREAREAAARAEEQRRRDEDRRQSEEALRRIEAAIAEERRRTDEKFTQMMQAMQASLQAAPKGPDPMMMLLLESQKAQAAAAAESARVQAEAQREAARLQAEVEKERARAEAEAARTAADNQQRMLQAMQAVMMPQMMSPAEAARMVREASNGADQFTRTMLTNMNDMMGVQREFLSNLLQMAPQGGGTAERVIGAIENIAEKYTQGQAQVESARAAAVRAQAEAQARAVAGWAPPPPVAQPGQAPSQGLNGAVVTPPPAHVPEQLPQQGEQPAAPVEGSAANVVRMGKTDAEWFGAALPDVQRLRDGVTVYLQAVDGDDAVLNQPDDEPITIVDEDGKALGVSPLLAARVMVMAAAQVNSKNIPGVEAVSYLFNQQMYAALADITLPNAPDAFRREVVMYLNRIINGEPVHREGDAPMYGIAPFLESIEGGGDAQPAAPMPPPTKAKGNGKPARAR